MYDQDLLYSWTPKEFRNRLKGAHLRNIDQYEYMAKSAMANAYAQNAGKKAKEKKIFDKQKAISLMERDMKWQNAKEKDMSRIRKLTESLKGFKPEFRKRGGN